MTLTVGGCVAIRERVETTPTPGPVRGAVVNSAAAAAAAASAAGYPDDVMYAIEGATFIAEHLKDEDEGANVSVHDML